MPEQREIGHNTIDSNLPTCSGWKRGRVELFQTGSRGSLYSACIESSFGMRPGQAMRRLLSAVNIWHKTNILAAYVPTRTQIHTCVCVCSMQCVCVCVEGVF